MPKGTRNYRNTRFLMAGTPGLLYNAEGGAEGTGGGGGQGNTEGTGAGETGQGKPGETPEQTIAALREALAKSNDDAKNNRQKAKDRDELQRQLDELRAAGETVDQKAQREAEKAIQKARDEAAAEARAEVTRDRVFDKIEVAATGKFTDPTDARLHLEKRVEELIKDGTPDLEAITKAVDQLLVDKPHLAANTKTPVPSPGRAGIGTGSSSASDAVRPGLGRLQHAYAQSPHNK